MRLKNKLQTPAPAGKKPKARFSPAKAAYYAFLSFMMFLMATQPVYAADVWTKATEIMKDVYNQIVLISTVAAIVTASLCADTQRPEPFLVPIFLSVHGPLRLSYEPVRWEAPVTLQGFS